jgi:5-methylcytosine-specific restriction enzyme A
MAGWANDGRRKSQLPKNWQQIRLKVLERDGYRCRGILPDGRGTVCGRYANQCDHIDQSRGDDHTLDNLQSLCASCHARKWGKEGAANTPQVKYPMNRKPGLHPGLKRPDEM